MVPYLCADLIRNNDMRKGKIVNSSHQICVRKHNWVFYIYLLEGVTINNEKAREIRSRKNYIEQP